MLNRSAPTVMFTETKRLFDIITQASHTTEKQLMAEVMAAKEVYNRYVISNVWLIPV